MLELMRVFKANSTKCFNLETNNCMHWGLRVLKLLSSIYHERSNSEEGDIKEKNKKSKNGSVSLNWILKI